MTSIYHDENGDFKKGHPPHPGCARGGEYGYLGKPETAYSDELLEELGKGVVQWMKQKGNIWYKYYFLDKWIQWRTVEKLRARSEMFASYLEMAKSLQEAKLTTEPYYKKADQNMARFMLARHHKGEWEEKEEADQNQKVDLEKTLELLTYLQGKSNRSEADSNSKTE